MPNKRSQPVAAPAPSRTTKPSKTSSRSAGNTDSLALPSSTSPDTPALTPASSSTDESTHGRVVPLARANKKKKLIKTVRTGNGGHGHGNGGHGGGHGNSTKGTMKTRRAAVGGPEAELSGDDDDDDCDEEASTSEEEEENANVVVGESPPGERVIQGVEGKSAPKSEVSMHTLLDGAKLRPQSQNISRGYELLTSPASRMVIPFDSINARGKLNKANTPSSEVRPASPGFSDDVEWEWEDLCFEMDGLGLSNPAKKSAYADVVKRAA
ncbi:hypothetical protein M408DRAFT_330423 [Serendipita vermifera MAFF 305830]|uniref:Uncharacterized protein n=1 Tax=Serendipita vermifera MAFF 305830 TaxID=933852 RepID=A0A0C3AQL1_SERVB|nr:hypothetical protein M408DRAFT_330423 [Serendipita vermifera MAFF 305830]